MEEPEFGTPAYFQIPGNREEFIRRTGFVDVLELSMARARATAGNDTIPPNDSLGTPTSEQVLQPGS
jgi:hypothetical protein